MSGSPSRRPGTFINLPLLPFRNAKDTPMLPAVRATPVEGEIAPVRMELQRRVSSTSSRVSGDSCPGSGHQLRDLLAPVGSAGPDLQSAVPAGCGADDRASETGTRAGWPRSRK